MWRGKKVLRHWRRLLGWWFGHAKRRVGSEAFGKVVRVVLWALGEERR